MTMDGMNMFRRPGTLREIELGSEDREYDRGKWGARSALGGIPCEGLSLAPGDPGGGWNFGYRALEWEEGCRLVLSRRAALSRLVGVLDGSNTKGSGPNVRCIGKE